MKVKCLVCDKEFIKKRTNSKHCSPQCNSAHCVYKRKYMLKGETEEEILYRVRNRKIGKGMGKMSKGLVYVEAKEFLKKLERVNWRLRDSDVFTLVKLYADMFDGQSVHESLNIESIWISMIKKMIKKINKLKTIKTLEEMHLNNLGIRKEE